MHAGFLWRSFRNFAFEEREDGSQSDIGKDGRWVELAYDRDTNGVEPSVLLYRSVLFTVGSQNWNRFRRITVPPSLHPESTRNYAIVARLPCE
jgi:hypothetical protein